MTPRVPDVVLFTVDSLRYDAIHTDNGDLAEELSGFSRIGDSGSCFHNAWATGPYTRTSVPAIVSGCYPWSFDGQIYEPDRPHIAEEFVQLGYTTGGYHSNPFLDERYGWDRGFDEYFNGSFSENDNRLKQDLHNLISKSNTTKRWARRVLSFLGRRTGRDLRGGTEPYVPAKKLNQKVETWVTEQSGPVFLWIHYMDVHNPWYPREGTVSEDLNRKKLLQTFYKARESPEDVTEAEEKKLRRAYQGSVQYFDRELDRHVELLEAELDDPLFCLTSDHGELFGESGEYFHTGVLEPELLHVPLLFSEDELSTDLRHPVSLIDVVPTLLSLADGASNQGFDGTSLMVETAPRKIFASARNNVRIISEESDREYTIEEAQELEGVSRDGKAHLQRLYGKGVDESTTQFEDGDLDAQLEALGYK